MLNATFPVIFKQRDIMSFCIFSQLVEGGSCRTNGDCGNPVAPYCSGFGYCTQTQIYGINGCQDCAKPAYGQ